MDKLPAYFITCSLLMNQLLCGNKSFSRKTADSKLKLQWIIWLSTASNICCCSRMSDCLTDFDPFYRYLFLKEYSTVAVADSEIVG